VARCSREPRRVITFGTFDLFHLGHLRLLQRARQLGDRLLVGVSSDELSTRKKLSNPVFAEFERMSIVRELRCVDEVFKEDSLELKEYYILHHKADVLVMGSDWSGRFDHIRSLCEVVYLPRTPGISTSEIRMKLSTAMERQQQNGT
jgi:glycerol-3-phosphate cytidylyltransferase